MKRKFFQVAFVAGAIVLGQLPFAFAQSQADHGHTTPDSSAQIVTSDDVRKISSELMAPCCWSMTADAHSSAIAFEMRAQIREALAKGKSKPEILQMYVAQYGERILAKPTKEGFNLLAWVLPFVAIAIGGGIWWRFMHRNTESAQTQTVQQTNPEDPYAQRVEEELKKFGV